MIEIILTFAYVGSFYKLKEFLSDTSVPMPRYVTKLKYSLIVLLMIGLTVVFAFKIPVYKILWAGD